MPKKHPEDERFFVFVTPKALGDKDLIKTLEILKPKTKSERT